MPKNLRKLNLSGNRIKNVPKEIERLVLLENLDISNNQLSDLPDAICSLDIIDGPNFIFSENHFCDASILPPCIIQIINFTVIDKLRTLESLLVESFVLY